MSIQIQAAFIDVDHPGSCGARPGKKLKSVRAMVVHNPVATHASAMDIRGYFQERATCQEMKAGATQYTIGYDGEIVMCMPEDEHACSCGGNWPDGTSHNATTINVECAEGNDNDYNFSAATYQSAIILCASVCKRYKLDPLTQVVRHYDMTQKNCPRYYVAHPDAWEQFKKDVAAALQSLESEVDDLSRQINVICTSTISGDNSFATGSTASLEEDFNQTTQGGTVLFTSKFADPSGTNSDTIGLACNLYEPIYPDLSTPPRNATTLYNNQITNLKDILHSFDEQEAIETAEEVIDNIQNIISTAAEDIIKKMTEDGTDTSKEVVEQVTATLKEKFSETILGKVLEASESAEAKKESILEAKRKAYQDASSSGVITNAGKSEAGSSTAATSTDSSKNLEQLIQKDISDLTTVGGASKTASIATSSGVSLNTSSNTSAVSNTSGTSQTVNNMINDVNSTLSASQNTESVENMEVTIANDAGTVETTINALNKENEKEKKDIKLDKDTDYVSLSISDNDGTLTATLMQAIADAQKTLNENAVAAYEDAKTVFYHENRKPVLGKIPNLFDPYPVDAKIAQLEMHVPNVTLELEDASSLSTNTLIYMINRFSAAEMRLVQLENIMATQMRTLNRLGARMQINCVYYGGQAPNDKQMYN